MLWNGIYYGGIILVWNMEDAQNGMEDFKNLMVDRLPYVHTNYIYSISTGLYQNLQQITKYYQTIMRMISHFLVLQCKF